MRIVLILCLWDLTAVGRITIGAPGTQRYGKKNCMGDGRACDPTLDDAAQKCPAERKGDAAWKQAVNCSVPSASDSAVDRARRGLYPRCPRRSRTTTARLGEARLLWRLQQWSPAQTGRERRGRREWRQWIGRSSRGGGGVLGGAPEVCAVISVTGASAWAPSPSAATDPTDLGCV
jgi:hypothetical protein